MQKTLSLTTIGLSVALLSTAASAVNFDYRHEIKPEESMNCDRFLISHTFENNLSVSSESKWAGYKSGDRPYDDIVSKGNELGVGYKYKVNEKFQLDPSVNIDSGKDSSTYKFNLKGTYKLPKDFYIAARYRFGDTEKEATKANQQYHQADLYLGYTYDKFKFEYNFVYKETNFALYKNARRDYEHNFVTQYKVGKHWVPFTEVGYVPYKPTTGIYGDEWEGRYRIGVKYNL